MKKLQILIVAAGMALSVAACGDGGKAAAEAGIGTAQNALDTVKDEAAQYVPEEVKSIENSLSGARDTFAKGNYLQALAEAQRLPPQVAALAASMAAKRAEFSKEWSTLDAALPEVVDSIQRQIAAVSKSKRLPAGVTKEGFAAAQTGADLVAKTWADATEALKAGKVADAVEKARTVKAKAVEVMTALHMNVPASLK